LTYPGGCPQSVTDLALRYCENKFSKYIILRISKSGRNLHVNIVYEIDDAPKHCLVILVRIGSNVILPSYTYQLVRYVTQRSNTPENVVVLSTKRG